MVVILLVVRSAPDIGGMVSDSVCRCRYPDLLQRESNVRGSGGLELVDVERDSWRSRRDSISKHDSRVETSFPALSWDGRA